MKRLLITRGRYKAYAGKLDPEDSCSAYVERDDGRIISSHFSEYDAIRKANKLQDDENKYEYLVKPRSVLYAEGFHADDEEAVKYAEQDPFDTGDVFPKRLDAVKKIADVRGGAITVYRMRNNCYVFVQNLSDIPEPPKEESE